jgi:hypothetical protein
MTAVNRTIAEAFYTASAARDVDAIARRLADDVDWMIQGRSISSHFWAQRP